MYNVKLYNKISKVGLDDLDPAKYTCSEDFEDYDAVLVRSAKLHDVQFPENLKCIARAGAGVNNIPLDRCAEEGIVVFNTPGANANAVKELVVCALLLASRKVVQGANWVKSLAGTPDIGPAAEKGKATYAGPEIAGKKLGIIGLGAIGVKVANAAVGLDMEVWGYDPFLSVDGALALSRSVKHVTELDQIFANCDYITIHVPLNADTRNTISAEAIEKMKDGVRVINLARGELVDTKAMAAALESGKVAAYVSDFASDEILAQENAVTLPHLGASTPESEDNCAKMAVKEIRDFLETGIPEPQGAVRRRLPHLHDPQEHPEHDRVDHLGGQEQYRKHGQPLQGRLRLYHRRRCRAAHRGHPRSAPRDRRHDLGTHDLNHSPRHRHPMPVPADNHAPDCKVRGISFYDISTFYGRSHACGI